MAGNKRIFFLNLSSVHPARVQ